MRIRMFLQKLVFAVGFALCWIILVAGMIDIANYVIGGVLIAEALLMIGDEKSWVPIIITGLIGVIVIAGNVILAEFFEEPGEFITYIVLDLLPVITIVFACWQFSINKIVTDHIGGALFGFVAFAFPVVMIIGSALALLSNFIWLYDDALRISGTVGAIVGSVLWAVWAVWARILYKRDYGDQPRGGRRSSGGSYGGGYGGYGGGLKTPTRNDVQQAAAWAAINCYMELISVSGSSGNITIRISGAPDSGRQSTYMDELAKQLSGYDTSGITIYFS